MTEELQTAATQDIPAQETAQEKHWYVVRTQTGHEDKVKEKI